MLDIENLKSVIGKKGGLATNNRFQVFFTPPKASLVNKDPGVLLGTLASGGGLGNLINDPRDITLLCKTVSLPGRSISTTDKTVGKQSMKIPYDYIDSDVSMTFILTNDYYMRTLFDNWMSTVVDSETYRVGYKADYCTDIVIQQVNQKGIPIYGCKLINAYPISIGEIGFSSIESSGDQDLTINFAYDKYVEEDLVESLKSAGGSVLDQIQNTADLLDNI